ncbi:MAG: bifunctional ADP-heptose synthase [Edaphocola sp.]
MPENKYKTFAALHVVVLGDVMLDNYFYGDAERISPEAPVPIVNIQRTESRLGGAANVALNCSRLGAKVSIASVVGNDDDANTLLQLLENEGIETQLVLRSNDRITTTKTRIISKKQQMMRLDREVDTELATRDEHAFIDATLRYLQIHKPQVLIFEDYNKGVLKQNVIEKVIGHCKAVGIITAVDPKFNNFFSYKEVDIFKPNLKEVEDALQLTNLQPQLPQLDEVHRQLRELLGHKISFITLSEHGVYYHADSQRNILPSHVRNVADVSGAGDTVIAVASMVYALTGNVAQMAAWANVAAGIVCGQVGVVPVAPASLRQAVAQTMGAEAAETLVPAHH